MGRLVNQLSEVIVEEGGSMFFLDQQIGPEKQLSLVDQCFLYLILNLEELSNPPAEVDSKATASQSSIGRYL